MYECVKKELKKKSIFKLFLNKEKRLNLCEIVRLSEESKFLFFDDNIEVFSDMLDDIERKLEKKEWENFHYQELTRIKITFYKEKGKFVYLLEDPYDGYNYKKIEDKNLSRLITIVDCKL